MRCLSARLVVPCLLCASTLAHADESTDLSVSKQTSRSSTQVVVTAGSGFGSFQDIQLPLNPSTGARADGTTSTTENVSHTGLPIFATIGVDDHLGQGWTWRVADLDGLFIGASSGAAGTDNATYSRLGLRTALTYDLALSSCRVQMGGDLELRRSAFANVSESHYLDSALVGLHAGLSSHGYGLDLKASMSPVAHFGFSSDSGFFGGSDLAESSAQVTDADATFHLPLRRGVSVDLGVSAETANVTLQDISAYQAYGLAVSPDDHSSRSYTLTTTVVHLGVTKDF